MYNVYVCTVYTVYGGISVKWTYFDGTVKVLVETLSCIETKHLNLKQRRDGRAEKQKVNNSKMSPLIAASATIRGQRGELWSEKTLIGSLLLRWVTN